MTEYPQVGMVMLDSLIYPPASLGLVFLVTLSVGEHNLFSTLKETVF